MLENEEDISLQKYFVIFEVKVRYKKFYELGCRRFAVTFLFRIFM